MTEPIVVKEYEKKDLDNCNLDGLQKYLEYKKLTQVLKVTRHGIESSSWVGVIKYKKTHFQILPKLIYINDNKENILKNTATFLCVFSVLFLICYRSSVINESFRDLNLIKAALVNANTVNAQIESDIQTQTDISSIESYYC